IDGKFFRAVEDIVAVDAAGEGFVFELFADAGGFDIVDRFAGFDEGAGGEEAGELVAGEENFVQMREARGAGVLGVAEDGVTDLRRPATLFEDADADVGMLLRGGVAFVVEVVQQAGGSVELNALRSVIADEAEAQDLLLTVGADAAFDGEGVLEQAGALGELVEERPRGFAGGDGIRRSGRYLISHSGSRFGVRRQYCRYLRVSCGLFLQS